jgi:hypothetical protein
MYSGCVDIRENLTIHRSKTTAAPFARSFVTALFVAVSVEKNT